MSEDVDMKRIQDALDSLSEHYDSVHIFATRHEAETEKGTVSVQKGFGNWFARFGQVREWLLKQDEYSKLSCQEDA
jgi:hypothetical protein